MMKNQIERIIKSVSYRVYFTDGYDRTMRPAEIEKYNFCEELIKTAKEVIELNGGKDIKFVCNDESFNLEKAEKMKEYRHRQ